jgi:hypothetical protein
MDGFVFDVPKDGLTYTRAIFQRSDDLIRYGIWGDLDSSRLHRWISNFRTKEERYFAACILDGLIYRSKKQTDALIDQLLTRVLPDITRLATSPQGHVADWLTKLRSPVTDPGIRLVAVAGKDDPVSKSAYHIARMLRRNFGVNERWFIKGWDVRQQRILGVKIMVFIDDILATGEQFVDFMSIENLIPLEDTYMVYAPLVAHRMGIDFVESAFSNQVLVAPVEMLDYQYGIFHPESQFFADDLNTVQSAKIFYDELIASRGLRIDSAGGFGNLQLAYAFEHAAPDNSLPLLWWREDQPQWIPLFDR